MTGASVLTRPRLDPDRRVPGPLGGADLRAAVVLAGAAAMFLAGRDGSPPWQATRLLVVGGITAAAVVAFGSATRTWRAVAAFAAGLFAVPAGAGIAVPHLAKTGPRLVPVAALLLLAGGLVLLVAGGTTLARRTRGWRRWLTAAVLLYVASVAAWSTGQAVAATNVPRTAVGSVTPADRGLPYRDVDFRTEDGVRLSGWYVPSANRAAVVLLHGAGSTRSGVLDHAVVLARHGYGVLLFDARGHGRSGGRAMDFGWYGDEDVTAAVSFLRAQPDVDDERIAAAGMSMGGEEAIGAAAGDPRIRAVVAEGATNRTLADKEWLSDEYGWRGEVQEAVDWLVYRTADLLTEAGEPISLRDAVAAAAPRPVLLVAGGLVPDEAKAGRHIGGGSPGTVDLWVVPGARHTDALDTRPAEWEARVTGFLAAALGLER